MKGAEKKKSGGQMNRECLSLSFCWQIVEPLFAPPINLKQWRGKKKPTAIGALKSKRNSQLKAACLHQAWCAGMWAPLQRRVRGAALNDDSGCAAQWNPIWFQCIKCEVVVRITLHLLMKFTDSCMCCNRIKWPAIIAVVMAAANFCICNCSNYSLQKPIICFLLTSKVIIAIGICLGILHRG